MAVGFVRYFLDGPARRGSGIQMQHGLLARRHLANIDTEIDLNDGIGRAGGGRGLILVKFVVGFGSIVAAVR